MISTPATSLSRCGKVILFMMLCGFPVDTSPRLINGHLSNPCMSVEEGWGSLPWVAISLLLAVMMGNHICQLWRSIVPGPTCGQ